MHHSRNDGYVVSPYNIKIPYRNQVVRVNRSINKVFMMFIIKIEQISKRYILALNISEMNFKPLTFGKERVSG